MLLLSILFLIGCAVTITIVSTKKVEFYLFSNVEALASGESSSGGGECYKSLIYDPSDQVVYCGTCSYMPGRGRKKSVCYNF